jgi:hypothetical protein
MNANTDLAIASDFEIDSNFGGYRVNAELEARSIVQLVRILEYFSFHIDCNTCD